MVEERKGNLSEVSETQKFQHIVDGIREDLTFVENLRAMLDWHIGTNQGLRSSFSHVYEKTVTEIKEWIDDVFRDKIYEINQKVLTFLTDVSSGESNLWKIPSTLVIEKYTRDILQEGKFGDRNTFSNLEKLKRAISDYRVSVDATMDEVRQFLYKTNWANMKKISLEDYILLTKRRKYITAREELQKAKQNVKDGKYDDVLNYLRSSIDLAIKERFGFKKIHPMIRFLEDANDKEHGLPLPSYQTLYNYYDEGSQRLHSGMLSTPFECKKALDFVDGFIEELEFIPVSQEQIDEFKKKCRWVE
jgi:hypothetical protein